MAEKLKYTPPSQGVDISFSEQDARQSTLDWINNSLPQIEPTRIPDAITSTMATNEALDRAICDWRPILAKDCQVYVVGEQYIAKKFDKIYYKFVEEDEAKQIVSDNLYVLLHYKYFPVKNDDVEKRINEIVKGITVNLKIFLMKINLDCFGTTNEEDSFIMKSVPNSAVAFSNGIFDFAKNDWILKYHKLRIPELNQTVILYDDYIIMWNFNFNFDPWPIDINKVPFEQFIGMLKSLEETRKNYCFELFYNMTHDTEHHMNCRRQIHLAQIFGYTLVPQFLQYFVMLIGSGQNGKNSLFDGCFSANISPRPASNSIEDIETDRFITASLNGACHNIFLETSPKVYQNSNMLKALTGGMFQTIENKGVNKYQGVINCKYIFAGNDQAKIKFSDTTTGFRRRINLFEIFYSWDSDHRFMKYGDYYATDFSGDLHEIKNDLNNAIAYIYLGMYGVKSATKDFTSDFKFTYNEWSESYSDLDFDTKDFFDNQIKPEEYFTNWGITRCLDDLHVKSAFYMTTFAAGQSGTTPPLIYNSEYAKENGCFNYSEFQKYLKTAVPITSFDLEGNETTVEELNCMRFLRDNDIYISLAYLNNLLELMTSQKRTRREFNDIFKKIYTNAYYTKIRCGEYYVKARLINNRLRFVSK